MTKIENQAARPHCVVIGTGQIGTFSIRSLYEQGWTVTAADINPQYGFLSRFGHAEKMATVLDVTDKQAVVEFLQSAGSCQAIVFAAGMTGEKALADPGLAGEVLLKGSANLVEAAEAANIPKLVVLSSLAVYGTGRNVDGSYLEDCSIDTPVGSYGELIRKTETSLRNQTGLPVTFLRIAGVFGPNRLGYGSHSSRLVERLVYLAASGEKLKLQGQWEDCDDLIYVRDVGRAVAKVASLPGQTHEVINIGLGRVTTLKQLVSALDQVLGPLQIELVPPDPDRAPIHRAPLNVAKMTRLLGQAEFDLVDALADFVREADLRPAGKLQPAGEV
jgi:UDP-glucose 4-epimerase